MSYIKIPSEKIREHALSGFDVYTLYRNNFPYNCLKMTPDNTIWGDCVCFIKSLIWAWAVHIHPFLHRKINTYFYNGENGSYNGIGKSGLWDVDINTLMHMCQKVPFSSMPVATLMAWNGDHIGLFIGQFSLCGRDYNGVEFNYYSDETQGLIPFWVDGNGNKYWYKGGSYMGNFTHAGVLPQFIDYGNGNIVTYRSSILYGWLPEVTSTNAIEDTAGLPGANMYGFMVKSPTLINYCCKMVNDDHFLPSVTGYDMNEPENGFAGDNKAITDIAINDPGIAYRVKVKETQEWLPEVYGKDYDLSDPEYGYAGIGKMIDEIEVWRID